MAHAALGVLGLLAGCAPLEPLGITTAALPRAADGAPYTASLEVVGAVPPVRWSVEGALPDGLRLTRAGDLEGVPKGLGAYSFAVTAADREGRSATALLRLHVGLGCGSVSEGELTERALYEGSDFLVDLRAPGGWALRELPLPASVTSAQVVVSETVGLFVGRPGSPRGSTDLTDYTFEGSRIELDPWALDAYRELGEPLQLLITAREPGPWTLSATCGRGSYVLTPAYPAVEEGSLFYQPFELYASGPGTGGQAEIRIERGELPDFVRIRSSPPALVGVAERAGRWSFDLRVVEADGSSRAEASGFAVHATQPLVCNDTPQFVLVEPPDPDRGRLPAALDPGTFAVFDLPLSDAVSAVSVFAVRVEPGDVRVGIVDPGTAPSALEARLQGDGPSPAQISAATWPSLREVRARGGSLQLVAFGAEQPVEVGVRVTCGLLPLVDWAALPVVPSEPASWTIPVSGGTPPYEHIGIGLPPGIEVRREGVLTSDGTLPPGARYEGVTVQVFDALGRTSQLRSALVVGAAEACGERPLLGCDEAGVPAHEGRASGGGTFEVCVADDALQSTLRVEVEGPQEVAVDLRSPVGPWMYEVPEGGASAIDLAALDVLPASRGIGAPIVVRGEGAAPGGTFRVALDCPR